MKTYYYCDLDRMGQRTGLVETIELPDFLVSNPPRGLLHLCVDNVHKSGYIEKQTHLYTDYFAACRAAES